MDKQNVKLVTLSIKLRKYHNQKLALQKKQKANVNTTELSKINSRIKKVKECIVEENARVDNRSNISRLKNLRTKCMNAVNAGDNNAKKYLSETESFAFKLVRKNIISQNKAKRIISSLAINVTAGAK